eukprot:3685455-Amphidinium_carterae.1
MHDEFYDPSQFACIASGSFAGPLYTLGERLVDHEWLDAEVFRLVGLLAACPCPGSLHACHGNSWASRGVRSSHDIPDVSPHFSTSSTPGAGHDITPMDEPRPMSVDASSVDTIRVCTWNVLSLDLGEGKQLLKIPGVGLNVTSQTAILSDIGKKRTWDLIFVQESRIQADSPFETADHVVIPRASTKGRGGLQIWISKRMKHVLVTRTILPDSPSHSHSSSLSLSALLEVLLFATNAQQKKDFCAHAGGGITWFRR